MTRIKWNVICFVVLCACIVAIFGVYYLVGRASNIDQSEEVYRQIVSCMVSENERDNAMDTTFAQGINTSATVQFTKKNIYMLKKGTLRKYDKDSMKYRDILTYVDSFYVSDQKIWFVSAGGDSLKENRTRGLCSSDLEGAKRVSKKSNVDNFVVKDNKIIYVRYEESKCQMIVEEMDMGSEKDIELCRVKQDFDITPAQLLLCKEELFSVMGGNVTSINLSTHKVKHHFADSSEGVISHGFTSNDMLYISIEGFTDGIPPQMCGSQDEGVWAYDVRLNQFHKVAKNGYYIVRTIGEENFYLNPPNGFGWIGNLTKMPRLNL